MKRNVSVEEISDGRRYRSDDLVKIGTNGCQGCCDCCRMDALIVLDPYDVYQIQKGTGLPFEELLNNTVRLEVIDGLIQPVLNMAGGVCPYLGADGRCGIHEFRPGICRLYPLGRSWEDGDFSYILQVGECTHCTGSKVKVKKWLGIPELPKYEEFCRKWHRLLKAAQAICDAADARSTVVKTAADSASAADTQGASGNCSTAADTDADSADVASGKAAGRPGAEKGQKAGNSASSGGNIRKIVCMQILQKCYLSGFDTEKDFYGQADDLMKETAQSLGLAFS